MAYSETATYVDSVAYPAVAQWAATHAYVAGQVVRQLAAPAAGSERCFICIVAGTSLSTEPTWVLTRGAKTTEAAGPTWMECTGLPALNSDNTNTNKWHASAGAIALGWIIQNIAGTFYFICTTAGNGGTGTEPAWNTTTGATTTDSVAVWTCIGAVSSFTTKLAAPHAKLIPPLNGAANWLLNAGMTVWVGDDHSELMNASYSNVSSCSILCFDHTAALPPGPANLKTTATLTNNTSSATNFLGLNVQTYVYGLQIFNGTATSLSVVNGNSTRNMMERCTFGITGTGGDTIRFGDVTTGSPLLLKDCTFNIANFSSGQAFIFSGVTKVENGIFTATLGTAGQALLTAANNQAAILIEGCDFSGVPSSAFLIGTVSGLLSFGTWVIKDCVIPLGLVISSGAGGLPATDNITIDLNRVDSGLPVYRNERYRVEAKLAATFGITRTGGASDGITPVSHQITTSAIANNTIRTFNSVPFAIWNAAIGANRNITLYGIVNDSRVPNNDEFWFDVEYLGSATSPKGSYARGGKSNILASGSALIADASAWDLVDTSKTRNNSFAYNLGDEIRTVSNGSDVFFCTTAGISAASEPASVNANTLNPADVQTMTLSNGNLTATPTAAQSGVRSASVQRSGKFYFEATVNSGTMSGQTTVGLATNDVVNSFTGIQHGVYCQIGLASGIFVNNVNTTVGLAPYTVGQTLCVAVDLVNQMIWFRINGGNWNSSLGAGNPSNNTLGVDISSVFSAQPAYACLTTGSGNGPMTINLGGSSFAQAVPSGFSAWNVNSQPTVVFSDADQGDYVIDGTAVFIAIATTTPQFRQNSCPYQVGNSFKLASNPGRVFFCTVAGTSASVEPGGYATAVDGGSVSDGTATFRAGCRFSQTLTLSSPQPQQAGYLYAYPKAGRPSTTYFIDPLIGLS